MNVVFSLILLAAALGWAALSLYKMQEEDA